MQLRQLVGITLRVCVEQRQCLIEPLQCIHGIALAIIHPGQRAQRRCEFEYGACAAPALDRAFERARARKVAERGVDLADDRLQRGTLRASSAKSWSIRAAPRARISLALSARHGSRPDRRPGTCRRGISQRSWRASLRGARSGLLLREQHQADQHDHAAERRRADIRPTRDRAPGSIHRAGAAR